MDGGNTIICGGATRSSLGYGRTRRWVTDVPDKWLPTVKVFDRHRTRLIGMVDSAKNRGPVGIDSWALFFQDILL